MGVERGRVGRRLCRSTSNGGFRRFFGSIQYRVGAVSQALQRLARSAPRAAVTLKRAVNTFVHSLQRHAGFLPGFHDGPVEWRYQQVRSALLPEIFFDFREIVEIVPLF